MEDSTLTKEYIQDQDLPDNNIQHSMYKLYYRDVYRSIYYIIRDKETSKDLTNEAFLKAYSRIKTLDDINNFKQWICAIGSNLAKNHIRKESKIVSFYPMETIQDEHVTEDIVIEGMIKEEQKKKLKDSLEELETSDKEIITLRYFHNLTYDELAETLSLKKGTVRSRLSRAKDKLYNLFNSKGEENEKR